MKRLIYITLVLIAVISCKEDSMDAMSGAEVATITGKWYLSEVEKASIDNKNVWEAISASQRDTLIFRADGVIIETNGLPMCCAPKSLTINGSLMDIVPQSYLPANPICASINCAYCPLWELTTNGNELIVATCLGGRSKYVR